MTAVDDLVAALRPPTVPADPDDGTAADTLGEWAVADLDEANWIATKVGRLKARRAEITRAADAARARIAEFEADATKGLDADLAYYLGRLAMFHRAIYAQDRKQKTVKLAGGTLNSRAGAVSVDVVDVDAFVAWAEANEHTETIDYKDPTVAKSAVAKKFGAKVGDEPGEYPVVDADSGEVAPGIAFVRGERNFTATIAEVDEHNNT